MARYVGVDLAQPALDLAVESLANLEIDLDLRVGDMVTEIDSAGETFDVILISFALHHLEEFYRGGNETQAGWLFAA